MRTLYTFFVTLFFLLAGTGLYAQGPRTAITRQAYEAFIGKSATAVETAWLHNMDQNLYRQLTQNFVFNTTAPLKTLYTRLPKSTVKTTDKKWIYANIYYHDVFSAQEKALLLHHETPLPNLGKIAYTFDRSDALFTHIQKQKTLSDHDKSAFAEHQQRLENLFTSLDAYYKQTHPHLFASSLFSETEIKKMLATTPVQPAAYAFYPFEFRNFAALPDLQAQKKWVADNKKILTYGLRVFQSHAPTQLKATDFLVYYRYKVRLDYLNLVERVLDVATQKRPSLLVRRKQTVKEIAEPVTDAQLLGFLQFQADTNGSAADIARLKEQFELLARYASAEALEAPYEVTLLGDYFAPELLGETEGARLRNLSPEQAFEELPLKLEELERQLAEMRQCSPDGVDFYKEYYRLFAKAQIYQTLLAKAHAQQHFR